MNMLIISFVTVITIAITTCIEFGTHINAAPVIDTPWTDLKNLGQFGLAPLGIISSPPLQTAGLYCEPNRQNPILGWNVNYNPCQDGKRTQICRAVYAGDPAYIAAHPDTLKFDQWSVFENGTEMPFSLFQAKKYPTIYPNIPKHPDSGVLGIYNWAHGGGSWGQDYAGPFVAAGWGALGVFSDMYGGTFNNTFQASWTPVYQPLGDYWDKLQYSDFVQCLEWARSLNTQTGPLRHHVSPKAVVSAHSIGVGPLRDSVNGNKRLGLPAVADIVGIVCLDCADWKYDDFELEPTPVPQTLWASSAVSGLMDAYRAVAKNSNLQVVSVLMYDSDHVDVNFFTEAEGAIAQENETPYDFSSMSSDYPTKAPTWPDVSDLLGHVAGVNVVQQITLAQSFSAIAYLIGNSIQAYLYHNQTALGLLQLDSLQEYFGNTASVRGYTSCGSTVWDIHNGQTTAAQLEVSTDTNLNSGSVSGLIGLINNQNPGTPCTVADKHRCTTFRLTCTGCTIELPGVQTTAQLLQCLHDQNRCDEADAIRELRSLVN